MCKNNGTCRIISNIPLCECTGGWAGQNCTKTLKSKLDMVIFAINEKAFCVFQHLYAKIDQVFAVWENVNNH